MVGGRGAAASCSLPCSRLGRSSPGLGENRLGTQQDFPVYPAPVAPAGAASGACAPGRGAEEQEHGEIVAAVVS